METMDGKLHMATHDSHSGPVHTYQDIFESTTFLSGLKFACPLASDAMVSRCSAISVYCSVRDWTRLCFVIGFENPHSASARYWINWEFVCFYSGERVQKYPDSMLSSADACGRKTLSKRKICVTV